LQYYGSANSQQLADASGGVSSGSWYFPKKGYDWLDYDWGDNVSGLNGPGGANAGQGDEAFGNFSAQAGGNGTTGNDKKDCPLLAVENAASFPVKFHTESVIYAPSAALLLTGNDNDASWTSAGIVARMVAALRWQNSGGIPSFGGTPRAVTPRTVYVRVCNATYADPNTPCGAGTTALRATATFVDSPTVGYESQISEWTRNPSS
jgi:hypothetical protein